MIDEWMYTNQQNKGWNVEAIDREELELGDEYDYLEGLAQMDPDEYEMVEMDEHYAAYFSVRSEEQAQRVDELFNHSEEQSLVSSGFEGLGMDQYEYLIEIDKETYLPHRFEVQMAGSGVIEDERMHWEQRITGDYLGFQVETIEPPIDDVPEQEEEEDPVVDDEVREE